MDSELQPRFSDRELRVLMREWVISQNGKQVLLHNAARRPLPALPGKIPGNMGQEMARLVKNHELQGSRCFCESVILVVKAVLTNHFRTQAVVRAGELMWCICRLAVPSDASTGISCSALLVEPQ